MLKGEQTDSEDGQVERQALVSQLAQRGAEVSEKPKKLHNVY